MHPAGHAPVGDLHAELREGERGRPGVWELDRGEREPVRTARLLLDGEVELGGRLAVHESNKDHRRRLTGEGLPVICDELRRDEGGRSAVRAEKTSLGRARAYLRG